MNKIFYILIINCLLTQLSAKRIYVDCKSLAETPNGENWENAYRNLQNVLENATARDTIWVAKGTYFPNPENRENSFVISTGVVLVGGFQGNETYLTQRNLNLNHTILSGERGDPNNVKDNHIHVLKMEDVDSTTLIDGFIITKGYADKDDPDLFEDEMLFGGGIYIQSTKESFNTAPRIKKCIFIENYARWGGAIYCDANIRTHSLSNPIIDYCVFRKNYASWSGGAIYKKYGSPGSNPFKLKNSYFIENKAEFRFGGAIFMFDPFGETIIDNCYFMENSTFYGEGGAILFGLRENGGTITINNSSFTGSQSENNGGAVAFIYLDSLVLDTLPIHELNISNCFFANNTAFEGSGGAIDIEGYSNKSIINIYNTQFLVNYAKKGGGGIFSQFDSPGKVTHLFIDRCLFRHNFSDADIDGNIYCTASNSNGVFHKTYIANSIFSGNYNAYSSYSGSNGACESSIINCTFFSNGSYPISKNWSPDFNYESFYNNIKIYNSIFWDNLPAMEQIFYNNDFVNFHMKDYQLKNCWIRSPKGITCTDEICQEGMIYGIDPSFFEITNQGFSISNCSPAVNSGNNDLLMDMFKEKDFYGDSRIKDEIIDMGAIESPEFTPDSLIVNPINCFEYDDGSINLVGNGCEPYTYQWTDGFNEGSGSSSFPPGIYQVTVTDAKGKTLTVNDIPFEQPTSISVNSTIEHASSSTASDGSIHIESISGGSPPYSLFWNNGDITDQLENLTPGNYQLYVRDANDCEVIEEFTVDFKTGTEEKEMVSFSSKVQPNPVYVRQKVNLDIESPIHQDFLIQLFDGQGRSIMQKEFSNRIKVKTSILLPHSAGLYFLRIGTLDQGFQFHKLVVF